MKSRLEQAFAEAAKRPAAEQELLAARLLAELAAEDDFDRAIAGFNRQARATGGRALAEHPPGSLKEWTRIGYEVANHSAFPPHVQRPGGRVYGTP